MCSICGDLVDRPVNTECNHFACLECLLRQYRGLAESTIWLCSKDGCAAVLGGQIAFKGSKTFPKLHSFAEVSLKKVKACTVTSVVQPNERFVLIKIHCPNGCQQLVFYENLNKHYLECLSKVTQTRSSQEENVFNAGNLINSIFDQWLL